VLALVAVHAPHIDLAAVHEQRKRFDPGASPPSPAPPG
jgi:hypothetical protein